MFAGEFTPPRYSSLSLSPYIARTLFKRTRPNVLAYCYLLVLIPRQMLRRHSRTVPLLLTQSPVTRLALTGVLEAPVVSYQVVSEVASRFGPAPRPGPGCTWPHPPPPPPDHRHACQCTLGQPPGWAEGPCCRGRLKIRDTRHTTRAEDGGEARAERDWEMTSACPAEASRLRA